MRDETLRKSSRPSFRQNGPRPLCPLREAYSRREHTRSNLHRYGQQYRWVSNSTTARNPCRPLLDTTAAGGPPYRAHEYRRIPEQIRGLSEMGPFWGCGKQSTSNHLRVNMGTANHVDDPGGGAEPSCQWARTLLGWLPDKTNRNRTARLQLCSGTLNTRSPYSRSTYR